MNDKKSENGIYLWADGAAYNGEWQDDKKHGIGIEIHQNGDIDKKKSQWVDGTQVSAEFEDITNKEIELQELMYFTVQEKRVSFEKDVEGFENHINAIL